MLAPDSRLVLLEQLRPPVGYRLEAAVATTFTLDLQAALIPPLAFAAFEVTTTSDRIAALSAILSCAERIDIFAQAGQISVPSHASDLTSCLEPMIHQVTAFKPGFLFHPKVWFLHYRSQNAEYEDQYRVLCGSRNLTGDRSWDVIARLDATEGTRIAKGNEPLARFIEHLPEAAESISPLSAARAARIADLAQRARRLEWDLPEGVRNLAFHALGLPKVRADLDLSGTNALIISPFCNDEGVSSIIAGHTNATLVSRKEALDALSPEVLSGVSTFVLDPLAGLGDPDDDSSEPSTADSLLNGLHAKVVIAEYRGGARVFLGSANATSAAYGGNVEFMVELQGGASALGIKTLMQDGAAFRNLLVEYTPQDDEGSDDDQVDRALEKTLRQVASIPMYATVGAAENQRHTVSLSSERLVVLRDGVSLSASMLTARGITRDIPTERPVDAVFDGVVLEDITPFIVFEASVGSRSRTAIVCATTLDDPVGRIDAILARQVSDPEKFMQFLALLLGWNRDGVGAGGTAGGDEWASFGAAASAGVLELVTRSLADNRQALRDLDRIVARLQTTESGMKALPAGFEQLWREVIVALNSIEGVQA